MFKLRMPYWACVAGIAMISCERRVNTAPAHFGYGRPATQQEIAAKAIAIRPDGKGLPAGSGTVQHGAVVYATKCAACHGVTGVEGPFNILVAPDTADAIPFDRAPQRVKAIGNYWPYATTVFDYVRRAMPFNAPGSLSDNEVYSVTAYLLYANKLIDSTAVMNAKTLPGIVMPARKYYVTDNRKGGDGPYE
ncbi:c-type cytochrome [Chitinophaga sp. YR627]|uniref:c-type cytochrome n=1 Tax=Chitinophaga sp. YR627 TaxID=1881041 RepID=UPI002100A528|nr:c-type cytochrome [Chitinophaga sp. YR627]